MQPGCPSLSDHWLGLLDGAQRLGTVRQGHQAGDESVELGIFLRQNHPSKADALGVAGSGFPTSPFINQWPSSDGVLLSQALLFLYRYIYTKAHLPYAVMCVDFILVKVSG